MQPVKKKNGITKERAFQLGVNTREWNIILDILGREPTECEAIVFAVVWSEDCSRIYSDRLLKFLRPADRVATENEGIQVINKGQYGYLRSAEAQLGEEGESLVVSVNACRQRGDVDGQAGVSENLENTFALLAARGAKPIGSNVSVVLGPVFNVEHQLQGKEIIKGLEYYLNRLGVPLSANNWNFYTQYRRHLMTHVFAVAARTDLGQQSALSNGESGVDAAAGHVVGDLIIYLGDPTRAALKSESYIPFPGDPLMLESLAGVCEEAERRGIFRLIQPVARGGVVAALFSLVEEAGMAADVELEKIPLSDESMLPSEILTSECPGRVLVVARESKYNELHEILDKWRIKCSVLGALTAEYGLKLSWKHSEVADVPIARAREKCPYYDYTLLEHPPTLKENPRHVVAETKLAIQGELATGGEVSIDRSEDSNQEVTTFEDGKDGRIGGDFEVPRFLPDVWVDLLASPSFASPELLNRVFCRQSRLLLPRGVRSAVCTRHSGFVYTSQVNKLLYIQNNAYLGAVHTVAEALRRVVVCGVRPLAIAIASSCGNPRKYRELCDISEMLRGVGDAAEYWGVSVMAEDLNLNLDRSRTSPPPFLTAFAIGVSQQCLPATTIDFKSANDRIFVLGSTACEIDVSEYAYHVHHHSAGRIPDLDFDSEAKLHNCMLKLHSSGILKSAQSIGAGGIAVALAHSCLTAAQPLGAVIDVHTRMDARSFRADAILFSESASRALVSISPEREREFLEIVGGCGVEVGGVGEVGGKDMVFSGLIDVRVPLLTVYRVWRQGLHVLLNEEQ